VVIVTAVALALAACGPDDGSAASPPPAAGDDLTGDVLVSAAASLTDVFGDVEEDFEDAHPRVDVILNLAGSSALREQLLDGAPADVFASADTDTMDQVVAAGATAGEPTAFATNRLQIAVPAGNPGGVTSLGDFDDDTLLLGLCAPDVPCGDFARQALDGVGVIPAIDTNEPDVRALLTKVEVDELDAGITYVTDVAASDGGAVGIDIPDEDNVVATYPIAIIADTPNPAAARAFVDFVLGADGQALLVDAGFSSP